MVLAHDKSAAKDLPNNRSDWAARRLGGDMGGETQLPISLFELCGLRRRASAVDALKDDKMTFDHEFLVRSIAAANTDTILYSEDNQE